jgi:magnesium transporter
MSLEAMVETTPSPRSRSESGEDHPGRITVAAGAETPIDRLQPPGRIRILVVRGEEPAVEVADPDGLRAALADPAVLAWIDLERPSRAQVTEIAALLGLHPLVAENVDEQNQRAKVELVEDVAHLVLFVLAYAGEVHTIEVDFVLGERFLLTSHDEPWDGTAAPLLRVGVAAYLGRGPDYLLYALADWIVDGYFPVLDRLADEIDQLQDDVMTTASDWTLERLFALKRELLEIRRATSPAREIFNQLTNREVGAVDEAHVVYFRDVYDHLIRVTDELDNYRELVAGTLDIYLTIVNNNLSVIMKRLTGVTVILAGIGAVAGIFGMSEAGAAFSGAEAGGFWVVTVASVAIAFTAAIILRRIDWI